MLLVDFIHRVVVEIRLYKRDARLLDLVALLELGLDIRQAVRHSARRNISQLADKKREGCPVTYEGQQKTVSVFALKQLPNEHSEEVNDFLEKA